MELLVAVFLERGKGEIVKKCVCKSVYVCVCVCVYSFVLIWLSHLKHAARRASL